MSILKKSFVQSEATGGVELFPTMSGDEEFVRLAETGAVRGFGVVRLADVPPETVRQLFPNNSVVEGLLASESEQRKNQKALQIVRRGTRSPVKRRLRRQAKK